jgi:hypothetical protein
MRLHNQSGHFTPRSAASPPAAAEEALVSDARAGLTPAEMVERKLASLLQGAPLPLSQRKTVSPRRPLS